MYPSTMKITMNQIYQQMINDNIMDDLADFNVPWKDAIDEGELNQAFITLGYYSQSANKRISPMIFDFCNSGVNEIHITPLNTGQRTRIAGCVYNIFNRKWSKLWAIYDVEYNPISNYDMEETETENISESHAGTNTGTVTTVTDGELKQTGTVANSGSSSSDNGIYGFNSSSAVGDTDNSSTVSNTRTDNITNTDDTTETETRNLADSRNEIRSDSRTLTRSGNIGVTTSQQMIQSEIELWQWNFFKTVFADIDSVCCLDIY